MSSETPRRLDRRIVVYLIAAVAALPVLAAYGLYFFWRPGSFTNYGEMLAPTSIADASVRQPDGTSFDFAALKGKWVLLMIDSGGCDALCQDKLYKIRQVRLTQGQNMARIERAWLIDDDAVPDARLTADHAGTHQIRAKGSALIKRFPAERSPREHIYIVDPLGNVILRYARGADATGIKKDLGRLLRASRIG